METTVSMNSSRRDQILETRRMEREQNRIPARSVIVPPPITNTVPLDMSGKQQYHILSHSRLPAKEPSQQSRPNAIRWLHPFVTSEKPADVNPVQWTDGPPRPVKKTFGVVSFVEKTYGKLKTESPIDWHDRPKTSLPAPKDLTRKVSNFNIVSNSTVAMPAATGSFACVSTFKTDDRKDLADPIVWQRSPYVPPASDKFGCKHLFKSDDNSDRSNPLTWTPGQPLSVTNPRPATQRPAASPVVAVPVKQQENMHRQKSVPALKDAPWQMQQKRF